MRLIDADAVIEKYGNWYTEQVPEEGYIGSLKTLLSDEPTVDAEPVRHGQWIKMTGMMPPECRGHYECSECGWHMRGPRGSFNREEELAFCPTCGAKMDGAMKRDG